jgi:hypothetical protein
MSKMYVSDLRQLLEDIAQEATLSAAKSVLDTIAAKDMATEATLAAMKQEITTVKSDLATVKSALGDGTAKVQLNGSIAEGLSRRFIGINRIMVIGEIAAQTTETVHTYAYGADIEFLEFSTNIENAVSMELEAFEPDGTTAGAIFILGNSADSAKPLTPLQLRAHKSALFELLVDDAGMYKIGLRRQMPVGNGFKVSIKNGSADTAYRYGLFIYYNKCAV